MVMAILCGKVNNYSISVLTATITLIAFHPIMLPVCSIIKQNGLNEEMITAGNMAFQSYLLCKFIGLLVSFRYWKREWGVERISTIMHMTFRNYSLNENLIMLNMLANGFNFFNVVVVIV